MTVSIKNLAPQLGNSLFQIAAAYAYAKRHNLEFLCPTWAHANYFKHNFTFGYNNPVYTLSQVGFHYEELLFTESMRNKDIEINCFNGYFQSEKFFVDQEKEIRKVFSMGGDKVDDFCSIHIRRGDYLTQPQYHPALTLSYYEKAIEAMIDKGVDNFMIFSDDITWSTENVAPICQKYNKFCGISTLPYYDDFRLMTKATHSIIANSSFSWMAAWLANSDVISPTKSQWFGSAYRMYDMNDLLPERWCQIAY